MKNKDKIVLVGGCFDILHPGHIIFLEKAKQAGDKLIVLLESDEKIRRVKGKGRPLFNQKERMTLLGSLKMVGCVIALPMMESAADYDRLIARIKPDIIAVTRGYDSSHHQRAAKAAGAKLKFVTSIVGNYSTSQILTSCIKEKF